MVNNSLYVCFYYFYYTTDNNKYVIDVVNHHFHSFIELFILLTKKSPLKKMNKHLMLQHLHILKSGCQKSK